MPTNTNTKKTTPKKPQHATHSQHKEGRGASNDSARGRIRNQRRRGPSSRRGAGDGRLEFAQKIIDIRRVTRVVAGGRRFSFSVVIVLGDGKGSVGVGIGKATDTALAIEKAIRDAKKNMIKVKTDKYMYIHNELQKKY